jgi:SagB-type dehydrogenase family enzyme
MAKHAASFSMMKTSPIMPVDEHLHGDQEGMSLSDLVWRRARGLDLAAVYWENTKQWPARGLTRMPDPVADLNLLPNDNETARLTGAVANGGKRYRNAVTVSLPHPSGSSLTFEYALEARRSETDFDAQAPVPVSAVSALLAFGYGWNPTRDDGHDIRYKYVPSAGGLYSAELYLAVRRGTSPLSDHAVYHYQPSRHRLELLHTFDPNLLESLFMRQAGADTCAAVVFITGIPVRLFWKYGPRALRYLLQESGHIMQNMCLAAAAHGCVACPVVGFFDDAVHDFLRVDGSSEVVTYAMLLGMSLCNEVGGETPPKTTTGRPDRPKERKVGDS